SERGVNWDTEALLKELSAILPPIPDLSDPEAIRETPKEQVEERVLQHARDTYEDFEGQLGAEVMRAIERQVMLRVIDSHWVQHLTAMENLRQGIGLHAFGQRDPLVMYKKEGHEAFQNLQTRMQRDIAYMIYHAAYSQINAMNGVTPTNRQQRRATASNGQPSTAVSKVAEQARAREGAATGGRGKIGRNDPCYCGSGKKYKRCHGAAA
ncbi:MAG: SEC-C domain-containing protein, partial [Chloroflexi bacterium]|nr:SEC-C domain-containing protein [Chloroflexota bacterium]